MVKLLPEEKLLSEWQTCVDLMARIIGVPAGLIMRLKDNDLEVFVSSLTRNNPYTVGDKEHCWDSGLYCETVIRQDRHLLIPDALADPDWADNPDVELGMISYLGFPIHRPNGDPFGTICVLDSKPNAYSDLYVALVQQFRDLIESHLGLAAANQDLIEKSAAIRNRDERILELHQFIPVCSYCKKVRDNEGYWQAVERYIEALTEKDLTHGICPACLAEHHPTVAEKLSTT